MTYDIRTTDGTLVGLDVPTTELDEYAEAHGGVLIITSTTQISADVPGGDA